MSRVGVIYQITNLINNKIYIGKTINPHKRWLRHCNDAIKLDTVLAKAIRKYGIDNFKFEIIEECAIEKLSEREMYWIKEKQTCILNGNNGYNMTRGGEKLEGDNNPFYGKHHSQEIKEIFSKLASKRVGEKNPFYGKHHTNECKIKLSNSHIGKKYSNEVNMKKGLSGILNPFYGKTHNEETKLKISQSQLGKIPHNAISYNALDSDRNIVLKFESLGKVLDFLKEQLLVNENFTMSALKHRIKKSILENKMEFGYYWTKSVETTEKKLNV